MHTSLKQLFVGVAVAGAALSAQANPVLTTASLTGFSSVTGFADGTPQTFSASLRDLNGTVNATVLPAGSYNMSVQGTFSFTGFAGPGGTITQTIVDPLRFFSGAVVPTGATPGDYGFTFTPGVAGVNDTFLGNFGFSVAYDGSTSAEVLGFLNTLFGGGFVDPAGAGVLDVSGAIYSDGFVMDFTESDLTWVGFGRLLAGIDTAVGGGNGTIDGTFAVRDVVVTAVSTPGTAWLVAGALLALGIARRRAV